MGIKSRWFPSREREDGSDWTSKFWNTIRHNWHLGFTSFGGPPVHFKLFRDKFVTRLHWIDEQVGAGLIMNGTLGQYQELFSVCQAFSGPGSTKMHYCINLIHDGFLAAVLGFVIWSLPGALGMFGLAVGVSNIGETLPRAVYALLSGLNAATVGIIALAAVQLAQKAITDKLTRLLVFLGAAAGLLYNALWYFPLLMLIAGIISVVYDFRWLHRPVLWVAGLFRRNKKKALETETERGTRNDEEVELQEQLRAESSASHAAIARPASVRTTDSSKARNRLAGGLPVSNRDAADASALASPPPSPRHQPSPVQTNGEGKEEEERVVPESHRLPLTWKWGLLIIALFLVSFVAVMITRGVISNNPLLYRLFSNMYLAGTIIFGGGPVVIPLLREYVVAEGWVSPRDFLIGLALIQGFPGPNFNFAVYLGALTAINGGYSGVLGAFLGFLGIFAPGLVTMHGTLGVWAAIRGWRWVKSALRGVNAAAVGLIYTAVYRLWQIGWIDEGFVNGTSLANDPWWVVVTATSYVGGCWFGVSPPIACLFGAALGLVRYGVVQGQGL